MDKMHMLAVQAFNDPDTFSRVASGCRLRSYQRQVMKAIVTSIRERAGRSFVIVFARQAGKNELQAQLFVYLLSILADHPLNILSVSPTLTPQARIAMRRLEEVLDRNLITRRTWKKNAPNQYCMGKAKVIFLSADPSANVLGETAHLLLSVDEAQEVVPLRFARIFSPMAAAHNATRVFWGTAWTSNTLLAQELRLCRHAEQQDGIQRVWVVPAPEVAAEVSSYARFLSSEIERLGREHPVIRSQYFCEEIDAQFSMFTPGRLALMQGDQPAQEAPTPGKVYAFLLDAAGQDESRLHLDEAELSQPGRDACSLSIVEIDTSTMYALHAPTYRVIYRKQWIGINHLVIFGALKSLADNWKPAHLVIDATGVGEGLWALLDKAYPNRVLPVKFTQHEKSEIGWRFLAIIETGRFRDCCHTYQVHAQYFNCASEIMPGPAKTLRWGVPEGLRGADGEIVHDDYLTADALSAVLDRLDWVVQMPTTIISSPGGAAAAIHELPPDPERIY